MAENKFERKARKQINRIDEGVFSWFWKKILNRRFVKAAKLARKDPALQGAFDAYEQATKDLHNTIDSAAQELEDIKSGKSEKLKYLQDRNWKEKNFEERMKILRELGYKI